MISSNNDSTAKVHSHRVLPMFLALVFLISLSACNNGGTRGPTNALEPEPVADYWDVPTPDYSANPDRPTISLLGEHTVYLSLNDDYEELGATSTDLQDGNLSGDIVIEGMVDTSRKGDYLLRYSVVDSSSLNALEVVRLVRVTDDGSEVISPRPIGATMSHLGYIEHLPKDYGRATASTYPLLIYNHGSAANTQFAGSDPLAALSLLLENAGPPLLINAGRWDENLPFIVLMPQFGFIEGADSMERLNGFVDYAIQTYAVDSSRVYMSGWSQGGFLSVDYAINFPQRVAAILPLSSGSPFVDEMPANFCDIESVPVWAFHGELDNVVGAQASIDLISLINQNCQPREIAKLTIFKDKPHSIHHPVFNLSAMQGASLEFEHDPNYEAYDQSVFEWLLSHSNQ